MLFECRITVSIATKIKLGRRDL